MMNRRELIEAGMVAGAAALFTGGTASASAENTAARPDPTRKDRTAVVFIEFQREWLDSDGKLNHLAADRPQLDSAVRAATRLIGGVRAGGLRTAHVGLHFTEGHPELGEAKLGLRHVIPTVKTFVGRGAEFVPPFDPRPGEFVASGRTGASAFAGSNLDSYLRNNGVDTLLLAGFALHVCVESTLRQAHDLGYTTYLVEDAAAAFTPEQRRHVLEDVVHHYGASITTDQALAAFGTKA